MALIEVGDQFENIKKSATDAVKSIFPVEHKKHSLILENVWVEDNVKDDDYAAQAKTKAKGGSWGAGVYANLKLVDKASGKVIDNIDKMKLFLLPKVTPRLSYIVKGNEYQVANQLRLKSGAYVKQMKGGGVKTQFNLAKGGGAELHVNNEGVVQMKVGQGKVPLYPLLIGMGVSEQAIRKSWGDKILNQNKAVNVSPQNAVKRVSASFTNKTTTNFETAKENLQSYIQDKTEILPEMTKLTLGKAHSKFSPQLWLDASKKLISVERGDQDPDDVDNLAFKEFFGVDDAIKERIEKNKNTLLYKIKRNLDNREKIKQIVNLGTFGDTVESFFTSDDRSSTPEQINPLHMYANHEKITFMGPGAIGSTQVATDEMRNVHPTHLSFLDPVHSPESDRIGLNLALTLGAKKEGKDLVAGFHNTKTGKMERLKPLDVYDSVVAFPDQWDSKTKQLKSGTIRAQHKGKLVEVKASKVDYVMPFAQNAFALSTNMIPFLANDNGNRSMMAGKHMEQAIPLKDREVPLVQTKMPITGNRSFEEVIGSSQAVFATENGSPTAKPISGTVKRVGKDDITITSDGKDYKISLYNNFSLNQKTFLNNEVRVKAGDTVEGGQLLADSNFTKDGVLALGRNLKTAYIPYKGYNFEDGVVITESAAHKLTSEHIHKKQAPVAQSSVFSLSKFLANFPNEISPENREKLDETGVIKKGTVVKPGETVVAALKQTEGFEGAELIKARLNKGLGKKYRNKSEVWNGDVEGIVTDIQRTGDQVTVFIKTNEPARIGDKIAGRHGNKGIITKIIPDSHAPRTADGEPVDLLLNPHGVISRINIGQMYESAMGKVAQKKGEPFKVSNFSGENYLKTVKGQLEKNGVDDTEELTDPITGKSLGKVHVGNPYILKLNKQSEVNFSVRGESGPVAKTTEQPTKGGDEGSKAVDMLTMYSLLSHGSRANLHEMSTLKSENNPEFWEALKYGRHLPAPKVPYVFNKFVNMMKASGVDVKKEGSKFYLAPMTDEQTKKLSKMEITNPGFFSTKGSRLITEKGGFLDMAKLGGTQGENWGHIKLKEAMPNPIFEDAIKTLTGLVKNDYNAILTGKKTVELGGETLSGPKAIQSMLETIDVSKRVNEIKPLLDTARGNKLNDLTKQYRILKALESQDISPVQAYMRTKIPVIPPKFRPVSVMENGSIAHDDTNMLYRNVGILSDKMKLPVVDLLDDQDLVDVRDEVNNNIKALSGLSEIKMGGRDKAGFIAQIKGKNQPKEGFFQSKVLRKNQNLVGRGTIIPEPQLHMDEVALPDKMAWKLYGPFVVKELIQTGLSAARAQDEIEKRTPMAKTALDKAMGSRPVMLNRAPSLHKFSMMAFKPKLTDGKAIKIPPLVTAGYNADFDGDQMHCVVIIGVNNLGISWIAEKYGYQFIQERRVQEYLERIVPIKQGTEVLMVHLEDFPRGELLKSKEGKNGVINFYDVPEGVEVLSYDEETNKVSWKTVTNWSEHLDREIEIVDLVSGYQIITDDDPRAVYGVQAGEITPKRFTPTEAFSRRVLVPRAARLDLPVEISRYEFPKSGHTSSPFTINKETVLDASFGYVVGSMAGDGWVSVSKGETKAVHLANISEDVAFQFSAFASKLYGSRTPILGKTESGQSYGRSIKWSISSKELGLGLEPLIGRGAENKHLPPYFLCSPKEFREGLFAGLMDTDGSISVSHGKNQPQLMAFYSSRSLRLIQEVLLLARSLGIRGNITPSETPAGKDFWMLGFSNYDIQKWGGKGMVHKERLEKLKRLPMIEPGLPTLIRHDLVPISKSLASVILKEVGAKRDAPRSRKSFYLSLNRAEKSGYLSRHTAKRVFEFVDINTLKDHSDFPTWMSIVENTDVTWEPVKSVWKTGMRKTGYDLTVPGYETFMNVEGVILSNTMTVHVPVGDKAVREAYKMFPSRNLFKPGTGSLMVGPSQESQLGFYLMTKTPEGREKINKVLPDNFDVHAPLDKKASKDLFMRLSKELSNDTFSTLIDTIKVMGEDTAYEKGFTLSMKDIEVVPGRDKIIKELETEASKALKDKSKLGAFSEKLLGKGGIQDRLDNQIKEYLGPKSNSFFEMVNSGARGNMGQLRQIVASPLIMQSPDGSLIPKAIKKSFAEGLDLSDYWLSSYGARKGMMDRALSTQEPGVFNKSLMAATMDNVVTMEDCNTQSGVYMPLDSKEIFGRFLQGDHKGVGDETIIDANTVKTLQSKGYSQVYVRSPLKCKATKGTCRHCYGVDENGSLVSIGDNLGAKAAQTIAEPLTQMVMTTFHSGGVAGSGRKSGYQRVQELLHMPKDIKAGKATLAKESGTVDKVEDSGLGGFHVYINGTQHITGSGLKLNVKKGSTVKKGDPLSEGSISPQELLDLKGMRATQNFMTDELQKAYASQDINIDRKTFETVVKSVTDRTQVLNHVDGLPYLPGDTIPYNVAEAYNKNRGEKQELRHKPYLTGIKYIPHKSGDWMAQMGATKLVDAIINGASQGWSSDVKGYHPIPAYAFGATFGEGEDGKY